MNRAFRVSEGNLMESPKLSRRYRYCMVFPDILYHNHDEIYQIILVSFIHLIRGPFNESTICPSNLLVIIGKSIASAQFSVHLVPNNPSINNKPLNIFRPPYHFLNHTLRDMSIELSPGYAIHVAAREGRSKSRPLTINKY